MHSVCACSVQCNAAVFLLPPPHPPAAHVNASLSVLEFTCVLQPPVHLPPLQQVVAFADFDAAIPARGLDCKHVIAHTPALVLRNSNKARHLRLAPPPPTP